MNRVVTVLLKQLSNGKTILVGTCDDCRNERLLIWDGKSMRLIFRKPDVCSVTKIIQTSYIWKRLRAEFAQSDLMQYMANVGLAEDPGVMRTNCYKSHPRVIAARNNGTPLPLPLKVYLDGVAFTSQLARPV